MYRVPNTLLDASLYTRNISHPSIAMTITESAFL